MAYQYVTYNEKGELVQGKVKATGEQAFRLPGYTEGQQVSMGTRLAKMLPSLAPTVKPSQIILLYRQLALLLESGIDIITSLGLLRSQSTNRTLDKVLGEIVNDLHGGSQLSAALSKHPRVFPQICCQSLRVGEQTGNLEVMLRQVADYLEKSVNTTKNVKSALMMPAITAGVAVVVVAILVTVVLPSFSSLYSSLGAQLPMITRVVLGFSTGLQSYGLYILLALLIGAFILFAYFKTPAGKYKFDKFLLTMPLLGRINHLNELSRCCRSISLLFRAGLSLTEILPLVIEGSRNKLVIEAFTDVNRDMVRGEGLSKPMTKNIVFLPMMVQMVKVGEETGNLDATLLSVAQSYETESEDRTRSLVGLIQPAMTLIIGGVVGVITLSLISAMYSVYGQI